MAVIRLTKEFSFEAAHALDGYDGPCREIHGHSYRLFVTVKGRPSACDDDPKCGMVMDFGVLKRIVADEIVSRLDHAFVLRRGAENDALCAALEGRFSNIVRVDYQPTCENIKVWIFTHGLATMVATGTVQFSETEINQLLTETVRERVPGAKKTSTGGGRYFESQPTIN